MSLRKVLEVALHFESFRNIDLFHQGLYHLRASLHREDTDGDERVPAIPCGHLANPLPHDSGRSNHHHIVPAHVNEEQGTFSTRSFLIRYCEEEVEINDIGLFRVEVGKEEEKFPLKIVVELMFADTSEQGEAEILAEQSEYDPSEFKCVSTQVFHVHGSGRCLHEYCPVVFDELHFCVASLAVHSVLLDIRFRMRPLRRVRIGNGSADGAGSGNDRSGSGMRKGNSRSTGAMPLEGATCTGATGLGSAVGAPPLAQQVALSFVDCLLTEQATNGDLRNPSLFAEKVFQQHHDNLVRSHMDLADWFKRFCKDCLTPAQREAFREDVEVPRLRTRAFFLDTDPELDAGPISHRSAPPVRQLRDKIGLDPDAQAMAARISYELNGVSCQVYEVWQKALNVMLYACRESVALLRQSWEQRIAIQWGLSILQEAPLMDLTSGAPEATSEMQAARADKLRLSPTAGVAELMPVEDVDLVPRMEVRPILFEQRYGVQASAANGHVGPAAPPSASDLIGEHNGIHLFVLVHGFQGSSFDMRLIKNNIALQYPSSIFLCSTANEENTEGDINDMGIRLAQEVGNYISDWCPASALGRISFVAHSLGGLIVRAAVPLLQEFHSKLFTFMTFSTSHLGLIQDKLSLFNAGFWVLKQWRKSLFLRQVSMTDHQDPRETFLYRLSKTGGLEKFRNIVFLSCWEDQYAPFWSARAEIGTEWDGRPEKDIYKEMVRSLWEPVDPSRVYRFEVDFKIPDRGLDVIIGRAAHIQFLECQSVMRMLIHNYGFFFR